MSAIRTEQGAWCATEFGTLPRTRRTPTIPLLPTTIRSAPISAATSQMASAAAPLRACVSRLDPGRPGPRRVVGQHGLGQVARLERLLLAARRAELLGAVRGHDMQPTAGQLDQLDRLPYRLGGRIGLIGTHDYRLEHVDSISQLVA